MVKISSDLAASVPSTMMEPQGAIDDWLLSFMNCDFESTDEETIKSGPLPLLEDALETTSPTQPHIKQPLPSEVVYIPNDLTVMMSEEEDQQSQIANEERNSDDDAMSIDEGGDIEDLSQSDRISKVGIDVNGRYAQDDEKKELEIATPSMADTPTTVHSSSYSEPSPAAPGLQPSPKTGTGNHTCPHCPNKSFPRMCDFT